MGLNVYACEYVCVHVHVHVCFYCMRVYIRVLCTNVFVCGLTESVSGMRVCMCTCTCTCVYEHMYACVQAYAHS